MFGTENLFIRYQKCHGEKKILSDFKNTIRGDDILSLKKKKLRLAESIQNLLREKTKELKRKKSYKRIHLQ
jgi:hypothetical protein